MVSLDFWFAVAYAAVSLAFIFVRSGFQWLWAAVLLWLGIRRWRTLVARNVGLYAYRPFVHPSFLPDRRQCFFLLLTIAVKRKTESFGRQANMPV